MSLKRLEKGEVRLVFSVLFVPDTEMDTDKWPGGPPADHYFKELTDRLDQVEDSLPSGGAGPLVIKSQKDLKDVVAGKRLGIIHSVEGGFHLGGTISKIDERVAELAKRGVAYITLAHLFWRQVATNAPAIPFIPDSLYARLFPQPETPASPPWAVRRCVRCTAGVLIDISHMRQDAIDETFALLRDLDKEHNTKPEAFPVIATHAGWRFGKQAYMLSPETIKGIEDRDGVIGLIMARHQLNDGLPDPKSDNPAHTVQIVRAPHRPDPRARPLSIATWESVPISMASSSRRWRASSTPTTCRRSSSRWKRPIPPTPRRSCGATPRAFWTAPSPSVDIGVALEEGDTIGC